MVWSVIVLIPPPQSANDYNALFMNAQNVTHYKVRFNRIKHLRQISAKLVIPSPHPLSLSQFVFPSEIRKLFPVTETVTKH